MSVVQLCPTLCDPMDCSLPDSSVDGASPGKNTRVGCHSLLQGLVSQGSLKVENKIKLGKGLMYSWYTQSDGCCGLTIGWIKRVSMITKNVEEAVLSIFSTKLGKWGYKETKVMCVCVCVCVWIQCLWSCIRSSLDSTDRGHSPSVKNRRPLVRPQVYGS